MSREGRRRWALNERFVIGQPGNPMMQRWRLISTPLFGLYVHFIYREDLDPIPHDHPWTFRSLVLRGGYREEFFPDVRRIADGSMTRDFGRHPDGTAAGRRAHHFPLHAAHRITSVQPRTVTLVLVGRKRRSWGFFGRDGWVDYRDALGLRPTEGYAEKRPLVLVDHAAPENDATFVTLHTAAPPSSAGYPRRNVSWSSASAKSGDNLVSERHAFSADGPFTIEGTGTVEDDEDPAPVTSTPEAAEDDRWKAEAQRQTELFHAETLTMSYVAQRLRMEHGNLCEFCARPGVGVWVGPEGVRRWLCQPHLSAPPGRQRFGSVTSTPEAATEPAPNEYDPAFAEHLRVHLTDGHWHDGCKWCVVRRTAPSGLQRATNPKEKP